MEASLKDILWVADEIPSDSPEVCVGQVIAQAYGEHMRFRLSPGFTPINTFGYFMKFIKNDTPGLLNHNVISVAANNVNEHATRLFIFKTETKTYIWYYNTWGYKSDISETAKEVEEFDDKYKNNDWWKNINNIKIDELDKIHKVWPDEKRIQNRNPVVDKQVTSEDRILYSTKLLLSYVKKYSKNTYADLTNWIEEESDNDFKCRKTPSEHIISVLYLLKQFFKKDHITVIGLCSSMPRIGPQNVHKDGCRHELTSYARKRDGLGSCAVWDEIYTLHVNFLLNRALRERSDHGQILDLIKNTLRHNDLFGEKHARNLVGKIVFSTTYREKMRNTLLEIFDIIPERKSIIEKHYYNNVKFMFTFSLDEIDEYDDKDKYIQIVIRFLETIGGGTMGTKSPTKEESIKYSELVDTYLDDKHTEEGHEDSKFIDLINFIMLMVSCKHDIGVIQDKKRKREEIIIID
jgi:hypothetical protein